MKGKKYTKIISSENPLVRGRHKTKDIEEHKKSYKINGRYVKKKKIILKQQTTPEAVAEEI